MVCISCFDFDDDGVFIWKFLNVVKVVVFFCVFIFFLYCFGFKVYIDFIYDVL